MKPIESDRLYTRYLTMDDLEDFFLINSDEDVMRYIRPVKNKEETKIFLEEIIQKYQTEKYALRLGLFEKNTDIFIGSFAIIPIEKSDDVQLGYALLKAHWGKGYATEITAAGLQYAFNVLKLCEIFAITNVENFPSQNVLLKNGFVFVKVFMEEGKEMNLYRRQK